jgi:hypothetical protein
MAQSRGWQIVEAGGQNLLLQRTLPANAPQAALLTAGASRGETISQPKLQVETQLQEHRDGVLVELRSYIVTNPGTETERRVDYTADYQDELLISLNSLASAWLANRNRIASEIPLPPDPETVVQEGVLTTDESDNASLPRANTEDLGDQTARGESAGETTAMADVVERPNEPIPIPETPTSTAYAPRSAPASDTPSGADENPMLALGGQPRRGIWAFYAEASARERGCTVGERGAILLNTTPPFELHEVQCTNGGNLLLQCQGGICRAVN